MIIYAKDYLTLKNDIDLDKTKNMSFYYKKVCAVSEQGNMLQDKKKNNKIKHDALRIKKIIEENYGQYCI